MHPYPTLREKYLKLCDHWLMRSDDMMALESYADIPGRKQVERANELGICDYPASLEGVLPEVWRDEYLWVWEGGCAVYNRDRSRFGTYLIYDLAGMDREEQEAHVGQMTAMTIDVSLTVLFGPNDLLRSDREEVEWRRGIVAESGSVEEVCRRIHEEYYRYTEDGEI